MGTNDQFRLLRSFRFRKSNAIRIDRPRQGTHLIELLLHESIAHFFLARVVSSYARLFLIEIACYVVFDSPLSRQQEISAFGNGDGKGDGGDDWIIRCLAPKAQYWKRGEPFHLYHRDTNKYLGTTKSVEFTRDNCGSGCPIMGQLEAFGRGTNDKYTIFKVEQGIHLSV